MNTHSEIVLMLKSRIHVIHLVSYEETRIIRDLVLLTQKAPGLENLGVYSWDVADQFDCLKKSASEFNVGQTATPDTILNMIDQFDGDAIFVLKDFHQVWELKKSVVRKLRNLAGKLPASSSRKYIVVLTPDVAVPKELKEDMVSLEYEKPDGKTMEGILARVVGKSAFDGIKPALKDKIVESGLGLSATQAERVLRKAIVGSRNGTLTESCIDLIVEEKCRIIRESGALEFYPNVESSDNVGGLEVLKKWLWQRKEAFSEEAREYGLTPPSGIALIGIPGTGKSLCAKMTSGSWKVPLLRLDMGAVFGSALGSSEQNLREAVRISEVISPCILWVDEIEKAFAGSTGDSGTASRVLAFFLTWMQERTQPVFVFATANDIERLPPEFLRKGRFDEVFFLDLPTLEERKKILEVHLKKSGHTMVAQRFDLDEIATESAGFVGAELEAAVKDAMFPAFMDGRRQMETRDLINSIKDMVPLAKSHREVIDKLRRLMENGLARNASKSSPEKAVHFEAIRGERMIEPF